MALMSSKLFLLFQLLLDFPHLFPHAITCAHSKTFSHELDAKDKEKSRSGEVCEALGEKSWHSVAQHSGQDRHDDQSGERSGEN
jgi:hypothetical protein